MNRNENNTLDDILSAAKAEFSEKGFQSASLRRIVKNADVTTGAFYGYFKSKEELFDALVGEQYDTLLGRAGHPPAFLVDATGCVHCTREASGVDAVTMIRVGKKAAGRMLDGREWSEVPHA